MKCVRKRTLKVEQVGCYDTLTSLKLGSCWFTSARVDTVNYWLLYGIDWPNKCNIGDGAEMLREHPGKHFVCWKDGK